MRASFIFILIGLVSIGAGVWAAWGVSKGKPRGLSGNYKCENFGLPDKTFSGLRIDNDLKVYGTSGARVVPVGKLDMRAEGLAYFDISRETLVWKGTSIDPLAQYIVDNAGDAVLILEMEGDRARMSYVCRRN
jgi:hypothetical protein